MDIDGGEHTEEWYLFCQMDIECSPIITSFCPRRRYSNAKSSSVATISRLLLFTDEAAGGWEVARPQVPSWNQKNGARLGRKGYLVCYFGRSGKELGPTQGLWTLGSYGLPASTRLACSIGERLVFGHLRLFALPVTWPVERLSSDMAGGKAVDVGIEVSVFARVYAQRGAPLLCHTAKARLELRLLRVLRTRPACASPGPCSGNPGAISTRLRRCPGLPEQRRDVQTSSQPSRVARGGFRPETWTSQAIRAARGGQGSLGPSSGTPGEAAPRVLRCHGLPEQRGRSRGARDPGRVPRGNPRSDC